MLNMAMTSRLLVCSCCSNFGRTTLLTSQHGKRGSHSLFCSSSTFECMFNVPERCYSTSVRQPSVTMTFEEYRKTRKSLKVKARVAAVPVAFSGIAVSSAIHLHFNPRLFEMTPEEVQPIFGMDPIVFAGICGAGSGILGFALGGAFFTAVWRLIMRETARQVDEWEANFLSRLQKHRFSDLNKYEDDYYGEKVMTLSDYRQWVRQQHKKRDRIAAAEAASKKEEERVDRD